MKYIVVVVMMCLQQTAILKWSLAALSLKQYLLWIQVLKLKSNSSNSCPRDILAPNILKKPEVKFQSTNFKIGDPDPFYDSNQ
jgi:hypothetical protein